MRIHPGALAVAFVFDAFFGFLWYSPMMFGGIWHELQPNVPAVEDLPGWVFGLSTLANIVKLIALAVLVDRSGARSWRQGIATTLTIWAGAVVAIHFGSALFAGKPMAVLAINMGFHLIGFTVFGALFGGWQRERA